jgi:hypothetical protein
MESMAARSIIVELIMRDDSVTVPLQKEMQIII